MLKNISNLISITLFIAVCFSLALPQSESKRLFPIYENDKAGFIDNTGKLIIPLKFDSASDFSEGLARIEIDNKLGFINSSGKVIFFLPAYINKVRDFADGLAAIEVNKKYGYIDTSGKIVIQPVYAEALRFENGIAHVMSIFNSSIKHAYIDKKGSIVIGFQDFNYLSFSDGVAFDINQKAFIDRTGKIVINKDFYTNAGEFSEGLAAVEINDKWGFINKNGDVVISPQFDWAGKFSEGLAPVRFNKWKVKSSLRDFKADDEISPAYGFIDKTGKIIIEPQIVGYADTFLSPVGGFSEGLAKVQGVFNYKWGFINSSGKMVIEPQFDKAEDFTDGLAFVEIDDKMAYIDKTGKYIWKEKD